jgi:hypothetical protein
MNPRGSTREPGDLSVTIAGDLLTASFPAADKSLDLHVAILGFGIETQIERGENSKRILAQEFVVLTHEVYRSGNGAWKVALPRIRQPAADRHGIALWISTPENPAPVQATGGWLP